MSKVTIALLAVLALVSLPAGKALRDSGRAGALTQETSTAASSPVIPKLPDLLTSASAPKSADLDDTVVVEAANTVVFRGEVSLSSVAKAERSISDLSRNLSKSDIIYLVLDTPGGDVDAGADFIDFLAAIPQQVKTVTMFAASMGFQIAENNKGERMITRNGTLMSHRAKLGGLGGQLDGEFETRYRMIKRTIDMLETVDSARMGITLPEYKAKIKDELWVHGFDSKEEKVADKVIVLRCGDSMKGEDVIPVETMFGTFKVVFDKCPLYKDPIRIEQPGGEGGDQKLRAETVEAVTTLFKDQKSFVKDYILTEKYNQLFR
jgi:ATP-dependent protease ClpP protease subunit